MKPFLGNSATQITDPAALEAFYADSKLMWRNVRWILIGNFGAAACMSILGPLMNLRLNAAGVSEWGIGLIGSINLWAVSVLVMYFSWKSDHRVSRWGRRIPYLLLSLPFIVMTVVLFPWFNHQWVLIGLTLIHLYFMDMKNSTYPLLMIDCVPRERLARIMAINAVVAGLAGFLSLRYGSRLADYSEYLPYLIGGLVLTITSLLAAFRIQEPPIFNPTTERFTPFATMKVAWRDRRVVVLMVAIALLNSFSILCACWMWFFAKQTLGLTRTETGAALSWSALAAVAISYPAGWLIDRVGCYRVLVLFWLLITATFVTTTQITGVSGLIVLMFLLALAGPFYSAGDMILLKQVNPAEVGSMTSTLAFFRNLYTGSLVFLSGCLINWTGGNYRLVFAFGFAMTSVSMGIFLCYRGLMKCDRSAKRMVSVESPAAFADRRVEAERVFRPGGA